MDLRKRFDNLYDGTAPYNENVRSNIETSIARMVDKSKCKFSAEFVQDICSTIKEFVWDDILNESKKSKHANDFSVTIIHYAENHIAEELKRRKCFNQ